MYRTMSGTAGCSTLLYICPLVYPVIFISFVIHSILFQVLQSCLEGMRKPDPIIYETVLNRLGVEASETVFLDDIGRNLKAAQQLGIKTIKVSLMIPFSSNFNLKLAYITIILSIIITMA